MRSFGPYLLPETVLYPLWRRYTARRTRSALSTASDHLMITIQDDVRLDVFWVDRRLGPGPGASLYVLGDEILRLDCFGNQGLGGHYHINPSQVELHHVNTARLFFPEGSHEEHVDRATFELQRNLPAALAMNRDARVRRVQVDHARLEGAAEEMRAFMRELLARHRDELEG